ncbi:alpha/beta hydrolase [Peterkaempfera sp. SMS 1(5)a]|uniref:alpha/beta hydrolase n=1 Tax=Peterkaempfera podocarpi TaxID=3232308 RepID=UPI003673370B
MNETSTRRLLIPLVLLASAAAVAATNLTFGQSPDGPGTRAAAGTSSPAPSRAAAAKSGRPVVVLVHGAWADTSSWNGEIRILQREGLTVRAIANPLENLTSDSTTVAAFVRSIPGPVVLVGHSYGGSVITNAAAQVGNVKALVFVDAAAPAVGETTVSLSGSSSALNAPPATLFDSVPYANAPAGAVNLYLKQQVFVRKFAGDLPVQQAVGLWASQRAASTAALNTASTHAAWKTIPSWYFISSGDRIITPESEMMMARRAKSTVTVFPGGSHLTLISHPEAVTKVIESAVRAVK